MTLKSPINMRVRGIQYTLYGKKFWTVLFSKEKALIYYWDSGKLFW